MDMVVLSGYCTEENQPFFTLLEDVLLNKPSIEAVEEKLTERLDSLYPAMKQSPLLGFHHSTPAVPVAPSTERPTL